MPRPRDGNTSFDAAAAEASRRIAEACKGTTLDKAGERSADDCIRVLGNGETGARLELSASRAYERFEPAADPNAPSQLARAWTVSDEEPTRVRARFHNATAARRALENRWHPSQREQITPDATVELCFEVAGVLEITPWILTWGDTIEVLEPPGLRDRLTTVALGMAQRYR